MPTLNEQMREIWSNPEISFQERADRVAELANMNGPEEPMECPECGERCSVGVEIGDERFCSEQCALDHGYVRCERCGNIFDPDDGVEIEGNDYCDYECAEADGWRQCERCGDWCYEDDAIYATDNYGDQHVFDCTSCAQRSGYYHCDHCGEWREGCHSVFVGYGENEDWCDGCWETDSSNCRECGARCADTELSEDGYCADCEDNCARNLHSYGYTPQLKLFGKGPLFLGVELETDGGSNRGKYCKDLMEISGFPDCCWMTEDGSLQNGVEITTFPMTLAEHVARTAMYEAISEVAERYGFQSHNGGRCGLHIHVSRKAFGKSEVVQDAGGYKMMRLLQRFETQFHIFSRRQSKNWCCYQTAYDFTPKTDEPRLSKCENDKELGPLKKAERMKHEQAHSQALNFQHYETFEFRIFRGTLKWSTYFASLALVEGMVHTVKRHGSIWVESVSWYDLIDEIVSSVDVEYARECLEAYLDEKGLR